MDVPVRAGDVLSQPTRARVFELLRQPQHPASTEELASQLGTELVTHTPRSCPYRPAVHERQPLVCALQRGITTGLVQAIDVGSLVEAFEPEDPDLAGCLVRVRGCAATREPADEAMP